MLSRVVRGLIPKGCKSNDDADKIMLYVSQQAIDHLISSAVCLFIYSELDSINPEAVPLKSY